MQLRDRLTGNLLTLDTSAPLGRGGEAQVYPIPGMPDTVAKIYVPGKATTERAHKLVVMLSNTPEAPQSGSDHVPLAWPQSLLTRPDDANVVVGFLMPRAHGVAQVIDYYHPHRRLEFCPLFDYRYLLRTARNLAAATRTVHARGYVIGDLKHSNVLVSQTALVTLVDADSFQVRDPQSGRLYPCQVGTPDYTPPERQRDYSSAVPLTPEHDLFALGVLIFQLLMEGTHPFAGVYTGEGEPPPFEERIAAGHFPYGANPGPYRPGKRTAPPFEMLAPPLQALFLRCFEAGHADPAARPDAHTWQVALDAACTAIVSCPDNPHHFYSGHLSACPWCERRDTQLRGLDPFPATAAVPQPAPQPAPQPVVVETPRLFPTIPVVPAGSPAPRMLGGFMVGWVGVLCAVVFGLALTTGQFHTDTTLPEETVPIALPPQQPIQIEKLPEAAPPTVLSPQGRYIATFNPNERQVAIADSQKSHSITRFSFPFKLERMEFSADEKTLLLVTPRGYRQRWDIALQKYQ